MGFHPVSYVTSYLLTTKEVLNPNLCTLVPDQHALLQCLRLLLG